MTSVLDAREKLAQVLAPVEDSDPTVLVSLVDSIEPPALMLGWGDPWLETGIVSESQRRPAFTPCVMTGHLVITCVASRIMPGDGIAVLERLVEYVRERIKNEPDYEQEGVTGPRVFTMARTEYLACRVGVRITVN